MIYRAGPQHAAKLKDLRSDNDKFEQDVWELNMQESRRVEAIGRIVRQINEATESLEQVLLAAGAPQELALRIDLTDSSDALSALDFQDLRQAAHVVAQSRLEVAQVEEGSLLEVQDEQRIVQDELPFASERHVAQFVRGCLRGSCPKDVERVGVVQSRIEVRVAASRPEKGR